MSFLKDGTPITRDTVDQAVEALALACALGVRQHGAILQLIETGKLETSLQRVPAPGYQTAQVFSNGLSFRSWQGMAKRLKRAGFSVKRTLLPNAGLRYELFWGTADPDVPHVQQKSSAAKHLRLVNTQKKGESDSDISPVA